MIRTFACKETEKIFNRIYSKKLPQSIQTSALKKLRMLNRSADLNDLKTPPANRLEQLSGGRKGNTVFELIINGVSVLSGKITNRNRLK